MLRLCKTLGTISIAAISSFLALLAVFGGIISGIWLIIIGEWNVVLAGFIFSVVMPAIFAVACLPVITSIALLLGNDLSPNRTITTVASFLTAFWVALLISVWTLFIFHYFMSNSDNNSFILLSLFGYSITMSPLVYMAEKETENSIGTAFGIILAIASYGILLMLFLTGAEWTDMALSVFCLAALDALAIMIVSSSSHEFGSNNSYRTGAHH